VELALTTQTLAVFPAHHEAADPADEVARRFEAEAIPLMRGLYASACRLCGNAVEAEDVVQETFLRAYRSFHLYQPGTNIRAWLYTILHRVRVDFLRTAMRSVRVEPLDEGVFAAPQRSPLATHDLERALGRVDEPFRTALVLRDVEDLSYAEIAEVLRVPVGTVMSRIHRGRALLRAAFHAQERGQA
jgi:RNA polymerase sigma-70 factor (ECF subfamily)